MGREEEEMRGEEAGERVAGTCTWQIVWVSGPNYSAYCIAVDS